MIGNTNVGESDTISRIYKAMASFYPSLRSRSKESKVKTSKEKLIECGMDNGVYCRERSIARLSTRIKQLKRLENLKK